jgi:hypothetical protein
MKIDCNDIFERLKSISMLSDQFLWKWKVKLLSQFHEQKNQYKYIPLLPNFTKIHVSKNNTMDGVDIIVRVLTMNICWSKYIKWKKDTTIAEEFQLKKS